jgi:hypothetical protein
MYLNPLVGKDQADKKRNALRQSSSSQRDVADATNLVVRTEASRMANNPGRPCADLCKVDPDVITEGEKPTDLRIINLRSGYSDRVSRVAKEGVVHIKYESENMNPIICPRLRESLSPIARETHSTGRRVVGKLQ